MKHENVKVNGRIGVTKSDKPNRYGRIPVFFIDTEEVELIDSNIVELSTGWENIEPAPIEFLHGRLLDLFHEWRMSKTENTTVEIDGIAFNNIITKAKTETYAKYHKQNLQKTIPRSEM